MPVLRRFVNLRSGLEKPIDQSNLAHRNCSNQEPDECVTQPETALSGLGPTKLQLKRTQAQHIPIAQDTSLDPFAVEVHQGVGEGLDQESFGGTEIKRQVFVPDALLIALQIA